MAEKAIYLAEILEMLGWSRAKFNRNREEMVESGAIFYDYERVGKRVQKRIKAFPDRIRRYATLRSDRLREEKNKVKNPLE